MKLISLELKNFRQHVHTQMDFADGVTGIIGPNGAGKTSLLEAIAWALYGSPAVRGTNDTIRSTASEGGAKTNAKLTFELSGSVYTVFRTLDGSGRSGSASLSLNERTLHSGMSEVSAAVTRLLGMDYQAFFTSFFTGQKQLEFMSHLDGRARAAAISRMLGYERVSKAREQANHDRLGLHREIEGLEHGLPDPQDLAQRKRDAKTRLSAAQNLFEQAEKDRQKCQLAVDELKPRAEESNQKAARHSELTQRLALCRADLERAKTRSRELKADLDELNRKRKELDSLKEDLKRYDDAHQEYRRQSELQKHEQKRQHLAGRIESLDKDIATLESRAKLLPGVRETRDRAAAELAKAQARLEQAESKLAKTREQRAVRLNHLQTEIRRLCSARDELTGKRQRISQAGEDGRCPTCERPLAGELPKVLAGFDDQVKNIGEDIKSGESEKRRLESDSSEIDAAQQARNTLSDELEQIRKQLQHADAQLIELTSIQSDLQTRTTELDALKAELAQLPSGFDQDKFSELHRTGVELRPVREKAVAIRTELEREPAISRQADEVTVLLNTKTDEAAETQKVLDDLAFSTEQHTNLLRDHNQAASGLSAAEVALERQRGEVKTATAVLAQIEREEQSYKSKLEELKGKRAHRLALKALAEALDAMRSELNARIRPELESIAGEFLAMITDGRYNVLEIDDAYRSTIRDDGELKPVISGGEEDVVNLALRLAISQMIADRAGQSFSLLILDEVFGSLDESRRENVVALLQNLKNRFEQIILITHIESIHDAVDSCVWVEFDERRKVSRLTDKVGELNQLDLETVVEAPVV